MTRSSETYFLLLWCQWVTVRLRLSWRGLSLRSQRSHLRVQLLQDHVAALYILCWTLADVCALLKGQFGTSQCWFGFTGCVRLDAPSSVSNTWSFAYRADLKWLSFRVACPRWTNFVRRSRCTIGGCRQLEHFVGFRFADVFPLRPVDDLAWFDDCHVLLLKSLLCCILAFLFRSFAYSCGLLLLNASYSAYCCGCSGRNLIVTLEDRHVQIDWLLQYVWRRVGIVCRLEGLVSWPPTRNGI